MKIISLLFALAVIVSTNTQAGELKIYTDQGRENYYCHINWYSVTTGLSEFHLRCKSRQSNYPDEIHVPNADVLITINNGSYRDCKIMNSVFANNRDWYMSADCTGAVK